MSSAFCRCLSSDRRVPVTPARVEITHNDYYNLPCACMGEINKFAVEGNVTKVLYKCICCWSQQNLMRHLKLVEDECQQMTYDDQTLAYSQFRDGLERCGILAHIHVYMYTCIHVHV